MYLKCHKRFKDGKEHRYWSIAERVRTRNGVSTRQVLYLGEINDSQRAQCRNPPKWTGSTRLAGAGRHSAKRIQRWKVTCCNWFPPISEETPSHL
jgi:hypothetical protein